jgi:hypothetical protein
MWRRFWELTKQCSGLSLNRQPCHPNERGGGILTLHHQPCEREIDAQHSHIIRPGWYSHLPANHSYRSGFPTMRVHFTLLFCTWGRWKKPSFFCYSSTSRSNQCKVVIQYNPYIWHYVQQSQLPLAASGSFLMLGCQLRYCSFGLVFWTGSPLIQSLPLFGLCTVCAWTPSWRRSCPPPHGPDVAILTGNCLHDLSSLELHASRCLVLDKHHVVHLSFRLESTQITVGRKKSATSSKIVGFKNTFSQV